MLLPRLEALDARLWTLLAPAPPADPSTPEETTMPAAEAADAPEPVSLDSDPRVRERLRFLLWMRRVDAEGKKPVPAGVPPPESSESA
jgi:hypothetical protein